MCLEAGFHFEALFLLTRASDHENIRSQQDPDETDVTIGDPSSESLEGVGLGFASIAVKRVLAHA